jgi:hypothetical protein
MHGPSNCTGLNGYPDIRLTNPTLSAYTRQGMAMMSYCTKEPGWKGGGVRALWIAGTTATGYFVPVVRNRSGVSIPYTPSDSTRFTLLGSFGNFDMPVRVAIWPNQEREDPLKDCLLVLAGATVSAEARYGGF